MKKRKVVEIKIFTEEQQGKNFYGLLGPYFADKGFVKIFGEPLHNEPGSIWFVMLEGEEVAGFCTIFKRKNYSFLNQFFMRDGFKGQGNGSKLFTSRLQYLDGENEIRAMVRDDRSKHLYNRSGFEVYGKRGSYDLMKKALA